jgi:hypothetical protein
MPIYRRKGPKVEARQFINEPSSNGVELAQWCGGKFMGEITSEGSRYFIVVPDSSPSPSYTSHAAPGDWILSQDHHFTVSSDALFLTLHEGPIADETANGD